MALYWVSRQPPSLSPSQVSEGKEMSCTSAQTNSCSSKCRWSLSAFLLFAVISCVISCCFLQSCGSQAVERPVATAAKQKISRRQIHIHITPPTSPSYSPSCFLVGLSVFRFFVLAPSRVLVTHWFISLINKYIKRYHVSRMIYWISHTTYSKW